MKTTRKCPKCGGEELTATEVTEAFMSFSLRRGVLARQTHTDGFGEFLGVKLSCDGCGHEWKPRKVKQVTDLTDADPCQ